MINIIDGKKLSEDLIKEYKLEIAKLMTNNRVPTLVVITVGDDMASKIYVNKKRKACEECGINFINKVFDEDVSKEKVLKIIRELNDNETVDGIFVQLPIPESLKGIEKEISIKKDIDGLNIYNLANTLFYRNTASNMESCTPKGIMHMLKKYNIELKGKHVVILGRTSIVGKPLIGMMLSENATVTSCNSYTENIKEITKTADIIISAIGKAKYINSSFISDRTKVIIDVGINREANKVCGDVDFEDIVEKWKCSKEDKYITPVPGGVGPMTVAELVNNLLICYKHNLNID